jgi:acyl carrier protein
VSQEEARTALLSVLKEAQSLSGREWTDLDVDAKPVGSLDGFDSLSGVEATVMIEQRVGCTLDVESIFVSDDGKRALTIGEISDRLLKLIAAKAATR